MSFVAVAGRVSVRSGQTIAQLALPQGSPLSYQATATIAHLLITSESDRARSPTASDGSHRARTGRWGRVSRFGNGSRSISDSRSRMSGDCSSKGAEGEEGGQEAGVGSSSSSSSLAGAASFVYRCVRSEFSEWMLESVRC